MSNAGSTRHDKVIEFNKIPQASAVAAQISMRLESTNTVSFIKQDCIHAIAVATAKDLPYYSNDA